MIIRAPGKGKAANGDGRSETAHGASGRRFVASFNQFSQSRFAWPSSGATSHSLTPLCGNNNGGGGGTGVNNVFKRRGQEPFPFYSSSGLAWPGPARPNGKSDGNEYDVSVSTRADAAETTAALSPFPDHRSWTPLSLSPYLLYIDTTRHGQPTPYE